MTPPSNTNPPKLGQYLGNYPAKCPKGKPQVYEIEGEPSYFYVDTDCNYDPKTKKGKGAPDITVAVDPKSFDPTKITGPQDLFAQDFVWTGIKGEYVDPKGVRHVVDFGMPGFVANSFIPLGKGRKETLGQLLKKEKEGTLGFAKKRPKGIDVTPKSKGADAASEDKAPEQKLLCQPVGFIPPFDPSWPQGKIDLYFQIQRERLEHLIFDPNFNGFQLYDIEEILFQSAFGFLNFQNMELMEEAEKIGYTEPATNLYMEKFPDLFPGPYKRTPGMGRVCGQRLWISELEGMSHREEFRAPNMIFTDLEGKEHHLYDYLDVKLEVPASPDERRQKIAYTGKSVRIFAASIQDTNSLRRIRDELIPFRREQLELGAHPDVVPIIVFVDEDNWVNDVFIKSLSKVAGLEDELKIPVLRDIPKPLPYAWHDPRFLKTLCDPKFLSEKIFGDQTGWPAGGELKTKLNITSRPGIFIPIHPQLTKEQLSEEELAQGKKPKVEVTGWHNGPRFYANEYEKGTGRLLRYGFEYFDTHSQMPDWKAVTQYGRTLYSRDIYLGGGEFMTQVYASLEGEDGKPLTGKALKARLDAATDTLDNYYISHEKENGFRNIRLILSYPTFIDENDEESLEAFKVAVKETQNYFKNHMMPNGEITGFTVLFPDVAISKELIQSWKLPKSQLLLGGRRMKVQGIYGAEDATSEYVGDGERVAATLLRGKVAPLLDATFLNRASQFNPADRGDKYSIIFLNPNAGWAKALRSLHEDLGKNKKVELTMLTPLKSLEPCKSIPATYVNRKGTFDPSKQRGQYSMLYVGYPKEEDIEILREIQKSFNGNEKVSLSILSMYPKDYIEKNIKPNLANQEFMKSFPKEVPWAIVDTESVPEEYRKIQGLIFVDPDGNIVKHDMEGKFPIKVPWAVVDEDAMRSSYYTSSGLLIVGPDKKIVEYIRPENLGGDLFGTLEKTFSKKGKVPPKFVAENIAAYRKEVIAARHEEQERRRKLSQPINLKMTGPDGKKVELSKVIENGKKTYAIVWGTWCPPCKAHFGGFNDIAGEIANDPMVNLMLIHMNQGDAPLVPGSAKIEKFVEEALKEEEERRKKSGKMKENEKLENRSSPYIYTASGADLHEIFGDDFGTPTLLVLSGGDKDNRGIVMHQFPMGSDEAIEVVLSLLRKKPAGNDPQHNPQ